MENRTMKIKISGIGSYIPEKKVSNTDFDKHVFLNEDGTLSKEVMPDLLHLNEKSYTTWAAAIEPKLKELMGEK